MFRKKKSRSGNSSSTSRGLALKIEALFATILTLWKDISMEDFGDLSLDVDADHYAETAAGDIPAVSRTYQSREQFEVIKASYRAKHDDGNSYTDFIQQVPVFRSHDPQALIKLDKKQYMLLGYAAGELYYHKRYTELIVLCQAVRTRCSCDAKLKTSLERWITKCESKIHG